MEAAERQPEKDEQEQPMFVDTSMLESDIQTLESEIMTPSPMMMKTALHEGLDTNYQTPGGKINVEEDNATVSSVRTPADNLLDKFQSLNDSWVDVKTRSASTKKRAIDTPSMEDLMDSPMPNFASALNDYCTAERDDENDEHDDVSSMGDSTTSTISSQESVFDRLHRHGTSQQRRRRRNQKSSDPFTSPREHTSTNDFFTPSSATSSVSSTTSRSRKSASKQQTKKVRNRVVPTSAAKSSATRSRSNSESKVSPASSQDSVFDRLYRNQKRTEILWHAPPTPQLVSRSIDRKRSGRRKNDTRRPSKIPAPSTPQTASKPQLKKKRISSTPATVVPKSQGMTIEDSEGNNSIEPLSETASAAAASSLAEDSTTDSTAVRSPAAETLDAVSTASEKENKLRPRAVAAPREQPTALKNANWSTTSIDEDLAELAAIQLDLDQQQQHLAPTPRKTNVPVGKSIGKTSSVEPKQLYTYNPSTAIANSLLGDVEDILKPQVTRSTAPSVASTATHTHVEDDDATSRASSGFFTLDHAQSSFTLQPLVSFPKDSIGSKQATVQESVPNEKAAIAIQSWWKSCLAQVSLANLVIEHRNTTFPSAHDTSPRVLLRIISSTHPHDLMTEQHHNVLVAESSQLSLEIRLAKPSFSKLRRQLSNSMLLRSALASARLEFEGIIFVEASQTIQRWWRRRKYIERKSATTPSSTHKVMGGARKKELSFYLEDVTGGLLDEELLETLSKDSANQYTLDRASTEPQETPICKELSLLGDVGDSDEELLVSPSKPLVSSPSDVNIGRELFPTPPSGADLAHGSGYEEASPVGYFDPVPVETPVRSQNDKGEQNRENDKREEAASVIQRSFLMSTLTSAIEHNTPTRDHMRRALSSPKSLLWIEDDPWLFKDPSDGFQLWVGSGDLIERNAARLATHNIVKAYLNGLRKYRRTKLATLIQSNFRRFQCESEYRQKLWAIVGIQHGWKAFKYRRMLKSKATKIKSAYKMKSAKTKFQTMKFAAILIQNQWRSYHATREYLKAQFLAVWLQRTCARARGQRQRFLALKSATASLQYRFRVYSTKKQYKLEMLKATRIQSVWRMSCAIRNRMLSIYFTCKIQALVRSHFKSRKYLGLRSCSITVQSALRKHRALRTYQQQRYGFVKVQALWRRYLAARWYIHQYQSVVRLQALGRMQQCLCLKRNALQAVVVIQRETRRLLAERAFIIIWRSILVIQAQQRRHTAQNAWFKTKAASLCLQSVGRAYISRRSFEKHRDAVVKIQSHGRSYNQRRCYKAARRDVILTQSISRQWLAHKSWKKSRAAAVSCQKTIRCHLSSAAFRKTKTACTNIQKTYRRALAMQNWKIATRSIIRIQSFLRMIHARDAFSFAMFSVWTLQRVIRGYQQKSKFTIQRHAAVRIQSIVRCTMYKAHYTEQKKASIVIQSIARRNAASYRLNNAKSAAVTMQKSMRKLLHRASFLRMQSSAMEIQSAVRGFCERSRYTRTRNGLLTIQRIWRGATARVRSSKKYRAALLIQRFSRGRSSRILATKRADRIVALQRYSRAYVARRQHERLLHTRLLLAQSSWRGAIWRKRFVARKKSALDIQTMIRGYLARKEALSRSHSAIVIQSHWRMAFSRENYSKTRVSAVMIQGRIRGICVRNTIAGLHILATCVQRHWRGHVGRLQYAERVEMRNVEIAAARLVIQSTWRMYVARVEFGKVKDATISIQKQWRVFSAREEFELALLSCILIQAIARGAVVRTRTKLWHRCSLEIQRSWRGYLGAKRVQLLLEEERLAKVEKAERMRRVELMGIVICVYHGLACISIVVQKDFARQQCAHARTHKACTLIQSAVRGMLIRSQISNRPSGISFSNGRRREELAAATKIQSMYRNRFARKQYDAKLRSATVIQKHWRSLQACRQYGISVANCMMIQSTFRGLLARNEVKTWRKSATCIQKNWRGHVGVQNVRILRTATMEKAATSVQSKWRMHKAAKRYQKVFRGAIHLQKFWRASFWRSRFELVRIASVMIQSAIRGSLVRREVKIWNKSAALVQKTWCRYINVKKIKSLSEAILLKQSLAATKIQTINRMHVARKSYHSRLRSVLVIQNHWRSAQARERYEMCRASSVIVQSIARGSLVRNEIKSWQEAVVIIQKYWLGALARERYELCRGSCVIIQSTTRGSLVRKKIGAWNESATCFQTTWRGYRSAKKVQSLAKHSSINNVNAATRMVSPPSTPVAEPAFHLSIAEQKPENEDRNEGSPSAKTVLSLVEHASADNLNVATSLISPPSIPVAESALHLSIADQPPEDEDRSVGRPGAKKVHSLTEHSSFDNLNAATRMLSPPRTPVAEPAFRSSIADQTPEDEDRNDDRPVAEKVHSLAEHATNMQSPPRTPENEDRNESRSSAEEVHSLAEHSSTGRMKAVTRMQSLPRTPLAKQALHLSTAYQTPENDGKNERSPVENVDWDSISAIDVVHDLLNRSATPIQKVWRGASLRGSFAKTRMLSTSAATLIQASFRSHRARQLCQATLMVQSASATLIQSNVRGLLTRNMVAGRGEAAVSIQRFWRNRSLRLALLQRSMDEILTKELEDSYRTQAAMVLQSFARRQVAQELFCATRSSIIIVQSFARGRLFRMRLKNCTNAAIIIQKNLRGATARSRIRGLHNGATIVQAVVRMFLVSRLFWFLRLPRANRDMVNDAARKIQVAFFLFKMRLAILSMQSSAIILKRCIRGQLVRSAAKFALVHVNSAFHNPVILSFARVVAGNDPGYAPTYVAWRRAVTQAEKSSTIVIQSAVRRFLVRTRISRKFHVCFDSHMLLDQTLIEEEDMSALAIQRAFKGWRSLKAYKLLLENHSHKRNQAAIHLQRIARGRISRILTSSYRKKTAHISRNATAFMFEVIQRSGTARVRQLLASQSSPTSLSSSLQRIADRTKWAQREAESLASNPLPAYAIAVLKNLDTPNDPPSTFEIKKTQIKPIRVETSARLQAQLEPRRPSTPVRCNKTPMVKTAVQHNVANRKTVTKTAHDVENTRQIVVNSQSAQLKAHTKPGFDGMSLSDLRKIHRETMKKTQEVKTPVKRSTMELPNTNVTLATTTQVPKTPSPKRATNEAGKNSLFGDPNNMPSPIKKENDWDWADEW
ncbi:unnamed protein product [Cylindrotheca closterium]|uniref:Calmodulin n=1 Tax=Cylindrotheca closterium TaxID=2856 RepID=A0AAD2G6Y1_9STRA|nr:unnamed protein product [Cylindrotheca closterium]